MSSPLIALSIMGVTLIFFVLIMLRNTVACNQRTIIIDAIHRYHYDLIEQDIFTYVVEYSDMESYGKTLWRLWDWGCKRILPSDKYEIIKQYIKR